MTIVREYDLSDGLLAVTHVWKPQDGGPLQVAVKGAPEAVADLCRLGAADRARLLDRVAALAQDGLRVLAVAGGHFQGTALPPSPHGFSVALHGLVGLADPARPLVRKALAECSRAGIRVVMITGDHPGTAVAIGRATGLDVTGGVLTGTDVARLDDAALRERVARVNVFARVVPEQKLKLVQALMANGEVVAMTGDGVNDAPALKAAHIGVAMGGRGTDVAREAAALVLLDDDFASLVATVRQGRRIYDNIRNAMTYLLAVHVPLAGMGLLPVLLGWPLFLFPVHVVFLEFVIDPACSLVFEAERAEKDVMQRPPRDPRAPLFTREMVARGVLLGLATFVAVAVVFGTALELVRGKSGARDGLHHAGGGQSAADRGHPFAAGRPDRGPRATEPGVLDDRGAGARRPRGGDVCSRGRRPVPIRGAVAAGSRAPAFSPPFSRSSGSRPSSARVAADRPPELLPHGEQPRGRER